MSRLTLPHVLSSTLGHCRCVVFAVLLSRRLVCAYINNLHLILACTSTLSRPSSTAFISIQLPQIQLGGGMVADGALVAGRAPGSSGSPASLTPVTPELLLT